MRFERISLSKEMFEEATETGVTFSSIVEREARKQGKFVDDGKSTAYFQQLAARDLQLSGAHVSLVEDFYKTEDNRLLFVETINEFVRIGLKDKVKSFVNLDELIATRTGIAGIKYEGAQVDIDNSTESAKRVGEGGEFPKVIIKLKDKSIVLYKHGYNISSTYEAIRRMKMNVFGTTMKVLGRNIAQDKIAIAVDVLINGDGNTNPIDAINAETNGTLAYNDIVNLEEEFEYYDPNMMIASKEMRSAYRKLTEYKDKNGPDMAEAPKKSKAMPASKIIALDTKASLNEIYEKGGSLVEYDKVINRQVHEAVVSEVSGYEKLFTHASKMLNVTF